MIDSTNLWLPHRLSIGLRVNYYNAHFHMSWSACGSELTQLGPD